MVSVRGRARVRPFAQADKMAFGSLIVLGVGALNPTWLWPSSDGGRA